jgi:hypothetical protein
MERTMNQKIVIDGKVYNSVDEMPPDVRSQYEAAMRNFDKNQNGTPDLLENMNPFADQNKDGVLEVFENMPAFQGSVGTTMQSTKIIVNGQTYDSVDQLPPDVRAKYQQAMGNLDATGNGIPDFMEVCSGLQIGQIKSQPVSGRQVRHPLRANPCLSPRQ